MEILAKNLKNPGDLLKKSGDSKRAISSIKINSKSALNKVFLP